MKDSSVGVSETPNSEPEKQEVASWLRTIETTQKWSDGVHNKLGTKRYINEYKNDWNFLQGSVSVPIVPINLTYAYVKTEIARLYFKDPWITVNAKRMEDLGSSQIAEQVINYTWGELDLKKQIKLALLEGLLVGHSYMKVGYVAQFGTAESQPKEQPKRGPGRPPKKEAEVMTSEYIKSENVFAYHVPYKDIIFDPSATYPWTSNARWMAHRIVKPLRAIKDSGIYAHTDELRTSSAIGDQNVPYDTPDSTKEGYGKDVKSVVLWEIYDLDNMQVVTVSPGCPYYLSRIDYPEWLSGGFPVCMLGFNPVPGEVFPLSDVAAQEGLVIEATKIVAIWLNHLKRWNRQIVSDPDLFTPDEEAKFKDSNDGAIIKASQPGSKDKMWVPQYAPVQADSYQIYNEVMKLWQMVAGQTSSDQGGQAKTQTRTLGELEMQMQGSHARADEKVDVLEDFIEEIARKLLGIMQKKYDLPKLARIVGPKSIQDKLKAFLPQRPSAQPQMPGGQSPNPVADQSMVSDFSFSWNRQDILGEMDVDVVAGSTVPMNRQSQLQILEKMIPLLPAAGVTPGSPAAKAYAREVFRLVGIQSVEAIIDLVDQNPQPQQQDPAMMQAQAKVQALQQETQIKLQARQAEDKMKLQAMQQKLQMDQEKNKMDMHKSVIQMILQKSRGTPNGNPTENGHGNQ